MGAVVDIISAYMFYAKGKEVFYENVDSQSDSDMGLVLSGEVSEPVNAPGVHGRSSVGRSYDPATMKYGSKNLNMISAFTHVGGDTMRPLSVFVAAAIATFTGVPGYLCDAWAAVVVSFTIVIMVIPLCSEINSAFWRILERKSRT